MSRIVDAIIAEQERQERTIGGAIARFHARYSPSKAHRWLVCPGSMHFNGEDPETEWAAEGTRKHAVLDIVLRERKKPPFNSGELLIAGDEIDTPAGKYKVPLAVLEQCCEIADFIDQFRATHSTWVVETETRVEIGMHIWPFLKKDNCSGQVDATAWTDDELLVLDAKFGFVQVEATWNPQLMLYAVGLLAEIPLPIKWVTLCIAQPSYDGVVIFREHRLLADDVVAWAFDQRHVVEEIQAGSKRLQADDKACRYCPARVECPARMQALEKVRLENFMVEPNLEELLPLLPRIRQICNDLEQQAMKRLNEGTVIRGFKLVASSSKRKWPLGVDGEPDAALVVNTIGDKLTGMLAKPLDFYEEVLKSPSEVEKAIRLAVNGGPGRGKMTIDEAKTIVEAIAFKPKGSPKLVPDTDKRPALAKATWSSEDILAGQLAASTFEGE